MKLLKQIFEAGLTMDGIKSEDILSKLADFTKKTPNNVEQKTASFALEDSNGNIIKVYVDAQQGSQFERALATRLNQAQEDGIEIAEVLFELRKQFNIVDVKWPSIVEDEEEQLPTNANQSEQPMDDEANPDATQPDDSMSPDDSMPPVEPSGSDNNEKLTQLLSSLIQVMTADSEAKRQDGIARAAESRAREAEAAAKIADQKLKAEEEVADMEAFYATQNSEKQEAKKLAKLAKYRHVLKQQEQELGGYDDVDAVSSKLNTSNTRIDKPSGESDPSEEPTKLNDDPFDKREEEEESIDLNSLASDLLDLELFIKDNEGK